MTISKKIVSISLFVLCAFSITTAVQAQVTAESEFERALDYYYEDDYQNAFNIVNPLLTYFDENRSYFHDQPRLVFKVYKLITESYYELGYDDEIDKWENQLINYFSVKFDPGYVLDRLDRTDL